jgi:SAM-dependent methyltransferase
VRQPLARLGLIRARSYELELLDQDGASDEDLASELRDIERINRWLGGITTLRGPMKALVRRHGLSAFTLLDVGTGGGEVPRELVAWASRKGIDVRAAGLDVDARILRYAAGRGRSADSGAADSLRLLQADGLRLPFPDGAFDFVTSSMMFHHFREAEAARLLAEMARVARRAVIVNDLVRHWVPWATIKILAALVGGRMVRYDGPLSVLRGWLPEELMDLAAAAGLAGQACVSVDFPYRLVLVVDRGTA